MAAPAPQNDVPEPVRAVQVKKALYTALKSQITINIKTLQRYFDDFAAREVDVQSAEEKANLKTPLKKCQDLLARWDVYIQQHTAHEAQRQEEDENYHDEDLQAQVTDRDKYDEKYGIAMVKVNSLCANYNTRQNRSRQNSRNAEAEQPGHQAQALQVVVREDPHSMNDSIRPDKLSHNASMFVFLNWVKSIEAYFAINRMDQKSHKVRVAALFSCLDEALKRMLSVHFAALPDVAVISDEENSYLSVLIDYFNDKYPLPIRVNDFFTQTQRPSESCMDFAQRCEALSISANVQDLLTVDSLVKYKITTGLIHSPVLRAKLLRKLTEDDFDLLKLKREIAEYEASEKVTSALDKMAVSQVNQMSAYRHQQTQRKLDGYRPQAPPPFQPRGQRPFLPRTRASSFRPGPFTRPRSPNACHTCGSVPYYQCHHFTQRQRLQGRGGAGPRQQFNRHNAIQANDADFEDEDPNFVNTISTVYDSSIMAFEVDPDVQYSTHAREFARDENGLPMMPNWRQTPLLYAHVRLDKRRYPNVQDRSMYYQKDTPITEVLCLPDTGCVQSVCHVDLAHEIFGVENFNRAETTNMYAANGQRLRCVGSVDAQISYFGIHCDFRVYLMEDVSKDYIVLDHHVCKYLQIVPMQFPLPLRLCNLNNMNQPTGTATEPFRGATVQNMFKNSDPHRPMSPPDHLQFMSRDAEKSGDAEKKVLENDIEKANKGQKQEHAKLDISCSFNIESEKAPALVKINKLVQRYLDVFNTSLRKDIKIPPVRLRFRKDIEVVPFKCTSAPPIPFALRDAARREIQTQVKLGIIEKVPPNEPLDWICPGMMLEKGNSRDCRLVVSAVKLNEFLDRDAFPQQSSKELVRQIPPSSKWFMTADFFKGFYQIPLHPEDQNKTAFMIHGSGLYRFKRLPQGATCSVDLFNRITDEVVAGIPNCLKLIDDILFHGPTIDSVLENFTVLLDRCRVRGFTLHPNKLAFGNRLKFAGYVVSDQGLEIDPKKVEAVRKYPKPANVTDMKSFIGLATQFQEACPFLMGTLRPLIDTTSHKVTPAFDEKTKKKIKNHKRIIDWTPPLEEAFLKAKKLLTDADGTVLHPYDPSLPLTIFTDASRLEGFGWLACQTIDGARRLIECGSSTIPEAAKRNFSVIELELACVEMAMRKLRMMTVANPNVEVKTDHQAIIGVLKKPLDKIESRRLMKLAEKLHQYSFTISHVSGIRNLVADALSRNPVTKHEDDEIDTSNVLTINLITDLGGRPPMNIETLKSIAEKDVDYQLIHSAILNGVLASDLPPDHPARPYKPDWHLLATHDSLITFNDRILVPKAARKEILQMLHFAHLGQQKTSNLANQLYYWKGMVR